MAATDQQILNEAKDSLLRILQTDTSSWSESQRNQQQLEIDKLERLIDRYETKTAAAGGRSVFQPIRRINL
jgi:hypothetical protein